MSKFLSKSLRNILGQSDERANRLYESDAVSRLKAYSTFVDYATYIAGGLVDLDFSSKIKNLIYFPIGDIELFAVTVNLTGSMGPRPSIYEITPYRRNEKKTILEVSKVIESVEPGWIFGGDLENGTGKEIQDAPISSNLRPILESLPDLGTLRESSLFLTVLPHLKDKLSNRSDLFLDLKGVFIACCEGGQPGDLWQNEMFGVISGTSIQYIEQLDTAIKEDPVMHASKRRSFQNRVITEVFIEREIHQKGKRQLQVDDAMGIMGSSVFLLLHRFVNLQRPASAISKYFPTPEDVASMPDLYIENINQLKNVLEKTLRFEEILSRAKVSGVFARNPEFQVRNLESVIRAVNDYSFHQHLILHNEISESSYNIQLRWHPFYEEAIQVILENCAASLQQIGSRDVFLREMNEGDKVALLIINFGTTISPSMLRDIKRHKPVDSSEGTGLGLYFTWTLLQYIGGNIDIDLLPGDKGVVNSLYIPIEA